GSVTASATAPAPAPTAVPFPVGERLVYGARYGPFSVGTATMVVAGVDTIRAEEAVHFRFLIDGGALWYHIHQSLESWVGRRDFRPERNPVIVEVRKRERVSVAGRKWDAIVVRPRIPNGGGIFAEKADARMWLSDEQPRIMLALQSNFSFGQVTLKLKEYSAPPAEHP